MLLRRVACVILIFYVRYVLAFTPFCPPPFDGCSDVFELGGGGEAGVRLGLSNALKLSVETIVVTALTGPYALFMLVSSE